jgi:undecaprenyl-phosphate 4-deoxy-4-formamido-L-arabinose transferase
MDRQSQVSISVVVPVYNSQPMLEALVRRVSETLAPITRNYELVFVNDGSRDQSWAEIRRLAETHSVVRGLNMMRNFGQHNALLAGIRAAKYEMVVTMDDDLQNPPEEIPKLVEKLDEGYDIVYGTPARQQHGFLRDLASASTKMILRMVMNIGFAQDLSAFRAFRTPLREAFADFRGPQANIDVLLSWGTTRIAAVTVRHDSRASGASNYTLGRLIRHAINIIVCFSILPLRLASILGFAFTIFGFFLLVYVVGRYLLFGSNVQGFPFLASAIAIFSGVQLFALGLIGEYIGRIHQRSLDRPSYVVIEDTSDKPDGS